MKELVMALSIMRKKKQLTTRQLSELSGIAVQNIESIEAGKREMTLNDFVRMLNAMELSASEILQSKEEKVLNNSSLPLYHKIEQLPEEEKEELLRIIEKFLTLNHNK